MRRFATTAVLLAIGAGGASAQERDPLGVGDVNIRFPLRPERDTGAVRDSARTQRPSLVTDEAHGSLARFASRRDSLEWERERARAERSSGFRLVISLFDRQLWAIVGEDTLLTAPIAVATGDTLTFGEHTWTFFTPRGKRTVLGKREHPVWRPPDWHYAEVALEHGLRLDHLPASGLTLLDGSRLELRDGEVGIIPVGEEFQQLPVDEHIVFDGTLYIPPLGSRNRQIAGELGDHMLDLGNGYLLHGTPHTYTIGTAATHGCIRLHDDDVEWLYTFVPVGTPVYIY